MKRNRRLSARKLFFVALSVAIYLYFQPGRERIHDRSTDAVQTAGNLISAAAKLSARMQHRKNHFNRRKSHFLLNINRNATPVVFDRHRIVSVNRHFNFTAITGQCFIDRIIHNFIYEVMQSPRRGRSYVHTRSFPDCLQTFQHLNLISIVFFAHALSSSDTSVTVPVLTRNFLSI